MPPNQTNLLQGTLDLLILKTLALQELHGLGISRRIEQITAPLVWNVTTAWVSYTRSGFPRT